MFRDMIVMGLLFAVVIILGRIILGAPFIRRVGDSVHEAFANGGSFSPDTPVCPVGSSLYMYDGAAFCCSGVINPDADRLHATCKPVWTRGANGVVPPFTFCTLGPALKKGGGVLGADPVSNCFTARTDQMNATGKEVCPPSMPTFVQSAAASDPGQCCAGPGNSDRTECANPAEGECPVSTSDNPFVGPVGSCQLLKAMQTAPACPASYTPFGPTQGTGSLSGIYTFGCSNGSTICYAQSTLDKLQALGYNVTGLTAC